MRQDQTIDKHLSDWQLDDELKNEQIVDHELFVNFLIYKINR